MPRQRILRTTCIASFLGAIMPQTAHAHGQIAGIGDFYGGVLHPLYSPSHIVLVLVLGLHLGQTAVKNFKSALPAFLIMSAIGLFVTLVADVAPIDQPILLGLALATACLVMLENSASPIITAVLFGTSGLLIGLDSSVEGGSSSSVVKSLIGTWLMLAYVIFMLGAALATLKKHWQRVGIRVVGSWVFAISLLVLAFAVKKG